MPQIRTLRNGLRIVLDRNPKSKQTCIVVAIGRGSSHEPAHLAGISHFLEHLIAKRYPWSDDIAREFDRIGMEINASTSEDCIMFYCTVPSRHTSWGFDLLADLLLVPEFTVDDVENERGVVIEELRGDHDDIMERVSMLSCRLLFNGHSLGKWIFGRRSSLERMTLSSLQHYWQRLLDPQHMVISVVGNFDREYLMTKVRRRFADHDSPSNPIPPRRLIAPQATAEHFIFRNEGSEHTYFDLTFKLPGWRTKYRLPLMVLSNILGGRCSSPIFLQLRDQGLVYGMDTDIWFFPETGFLTLSSSVTRENLFEHLQVIKDQLRQYRIDGIPSDEFQLALQNMRAQALMNFARSQYAAKFYAGQILAHGQAIDLGTFLRQLSQVRRNQVNRAAQRFLQTSNSYLAGIGPLTRRDKEKIRILLS